MEIKRRVEMLVATSRKFVVHQPKESEAIFCQTCGGATLTAEQTAAFFGISQRAIFQFIESGTAHFTEIKTGATMICLPALAAILDADDQLFAPAISERNE